MSRLFKSREIFRRTRLISTRLASGVLAFSLVATALPVALAAPVATAAPLELANAGQTTSSIADFYNADDPSREPVNSQAGRLARKVLDELPVKGRAPKTGYERSKFASGWGSIGQCDLRNYILKRDLKKYKLSKTVGCQVVSGVLQDPYTGQSINFLRGVSTSYLVQIDHVVSLSDAWQKGAQKLSSSQRRAFHNDPINLLAVAGAANSQKGDGDAATWLPPSKAFRCEYVARQVAVKAKYGLWVTQPEKVAIDKILSTCVGQKLPA